MLKGRNLGAAYVILLAVAINALAVTLWLALILGHPAPACRTTARRELKGSRHWAISSSGSRFLPLRIPDGRADTSSRGGCSEPRVGRSAQNGTAYDPGTRRCMSHVTVVTVSTALFGDCCRTLLATTGDDGVGGMLG